MRRRNRATAAGLAEAGVVEDYRRAVEGAHAASARIAAGGAPEAAVSALYRAAAGHAGALPVQDGFCRGAIHLASCGPAPAGHFSYRQVAWEMYRALERQHPSLAKYVRVTDFTQPIDLLQR